jgi:hypothetical protein
MSMNKNARTWLWVGGILLALVLYDLGLGWWGSIPPKRPKNVSPNAVFIFAPALGWIWPLPKRGDWLTCWFDRDHNVDRCRMSDTDGSLEYEGVFSPSGGSGAMPDGDLQIDVKGTDTRMQWVYFREQIMPIIHLRNGTILIAVEASEAAKQKLEWLRQHQRP